jgi:hypothetical protein
MAISNLTTQYISSSFQNLMQVSSSGQIYNGTGTQVTNLVLTSVTASFNGLVNSASVAILANTAVSASVAATVTNAAQPTITSVGTLTGLGVEGNVTVTGTLTANTYILSSSVTSMTIEFASGSTAFGNSSDDTHKFIGSVTVTGSLLVSGSSTFRNIGPAQFTGSIIATQGFTGSLQGTATSASMASYVAGANVDGQVSDSNRLAGLSATDYALNTSITGFAPTSSITGFATTSSLSSYALTTSITGFATTSSLASASVATASYINPTFISASAAASGFGTGGGGSVTINQNTDNNLITASGTANTFNGETRLTFNGNILVLTGSIDISSNGTNNGITGSLQGTATTASYVLLAESASYISPTFISASVAAAGFATTGSIGTLTTSTNTESLISNAFYTVDSTSGAINISLKPNAVGAEFTFFATNLTNDIAFVASSTTVVSEDSFLKMNKVGSAVTAKYYTSSTVALIGSLKA